MAKAHNHSLRLEFRSRIVTKRRRLRSLNQYVVSEQTETDQPTLDGIFGVRGIDVTGPHRPSVQALHPCNVRRGLSGVAV